MFNVFLTIFLFLALGWLSLLILGLATKVITIESKIDNLIKLQQSLGEMLKLNTESITKSMDATNEIITVQSKVINDFLDALTVQAKKSKSNQSKFVNDFLDAMNAQPAKKSKSKNAKKES